MSTWKARWLPRLHGKAIKVSVVRCFVPQSKLYVNSFGESGHIEPFYGIQRFFRSNNLSVCNDVWLIDSRCLHHFVFICAARAEQSYREAFRAEIH
jgi:hypothetical protein